MDKSNKIKILLEKLKGQKCTLIAASKTRTAKEITTAKRAGVDHFGENYIQEAISKIEVFKDSKLHLIGHLQSNKCKEAVKYFDYIHTVDRIKIAKELEKECVKQDKGSLNIFIQVNQTKEESKKGVYTENLSELITFIQNKCPRLECLGLMAIPPKSINNSHHFHELALLANKYNLKELSMGMSDDYEDAIKNGATYIRIGRAIFNSTNQ